MKFRISTMLLLVGLIGVSVGWIVDRQRWTLEISKLTTDRIDRDEKIYISAGTVASATRVFEISEAMADVPEKRQYIQTLLVKEFLDIYRDQKEIEFDDGFPRIKIDARCFARDALDLLDCDESADQFFAVARSIKLFNNHTEIHDSESNEFKSLEKFVSDTIAVKDQIYANGFENDPRVK